MCIVPVSAATQVHCVTSRIFCEFNKPNQLMKAKTHVNVEFKRQKHTISKIQTSGRKNSRSVEILDLCVKPANMSIRFLSTCSGTIIGCDHDDEMSISLGSRTSKILLRSVL